MTFGQVLDRIYHLMRTHFLLFCGIAAVPAAAVLLFFAAMMPFMIGIFRMQLAGKAGAQPPMPAWFPLLVLVGELVLILIYALYLPASIYASNQADLGITVTFREAYGAAAGRYGRYLWLMVLCILYLLAPIAAIAALIFAGVALLHHTAGTGAAETCAYFLIPLLVLLYIGMLVYVIFIMLRFALAYPASVEENLPAWTALRRSAQLTRGAKGRIFLVMLVVYAVTYAVNLVCIAVVVALAALCAFGAMLAHVTQGSTAFFILAGLGVLAYLLVIVAAVVFSYAAFSAALAVLYHDQRLRKDGAAPPAPAAAG